MVKNDQVKLLAASRNRFGNLSDPAEQTELLWMVSAGLASLQCSLTAEHGLICATIC
jgi:hypothetical protein